MKIKAFNSQTCVELICFAIFGVTLLYLVKSGAYLSYVTPRMKPYLYFTAAVMFVWCAASASRLFHPWPRKRAAHCYVLIIPVLLLLLPHGSITSANLSARPVGGNVGSSLAISSPLSGSSSTSNTSSGGAPSGSAPGDAVASITPSGGAVTTDSAAKTPSAGSPSSSASSANSPSKNTSAGGSVAQNASSKGSTAKNTSSEGSSKNTSTASAASDDNTDSHVYTSVDSFGTTVTLHGYDAKHKKIVISNDEFYPWISELFTKLDDFIGYEVSITGYVYHDTEYMAENEFVPARLLMSCCVADLTPCGLVCNYDEAGELKENEWVTVTGTIFRGQYMGSDEPQIKVKSIVPADPVSDYIYPF